MRNTVSKAIVAAGVAALSLAASVFATAEPASAQQWHGGGGGWHGGGVQGGGWHGAAAGAVAPVAGMAATPVGTAAATGTPATGAAATGTTAGGDRPSRPALVLGAAAAYPYYGGGYDACWQNRPVYSAGGAYLGYQMVNVCQ